MVHSCFFFRLRYSRNFWNKSLEEIAAENVMENQIKLYAENAINMRMSIRTTAMSIHVSDVKFLSNE